MFSTTGYLYLISRPSKVIPIAVSYTHLDVYKRQDIGLQ